MKRSNTGEEFVQALADIYRHPEVCLSELPTWIRNIIIVMGLNNDYDVFWEKVFQYADRNCSGARRAFY